MISIRRMIPTLTLAVGAAIATPGVVMAQKDASPQQVEFSTSDFSAIGQALAGTWKSTAAIEGKDVMVSVAPVKLDGLSDTLYVELAQADAMNRPYRQAIWQLHTVAGKTRLKTLEFRQPKGAYGSVIGLWAAPEAFPAMSNDHLVATMDMEVAKNGSTYTAKTLHPYPTSNGGATEMTSEVSFGGDTMTVADRGLDAAGKVVWGPEAGKNYTFARVENPVKVNRMDGGLVVIEFPGKVEGAAANDGDSITLNYIGYLPETNYAFDNSYERGQPFTYAKGQGLIEGWSKAMADATKGQKRRLVIPGPLAYGERGQPRAKIGPNATLIFDIDVMDVKAPAPAPAAAPAAEPKSDK